MLCKSLPGPKSRAKIIKDNNAGISSRQEVGKPLSLKYKVSYIEINLYRVIQSFSLMIYKRGYKYVIVYNIYKLYIIIAKT